MRKTLNELVKSIYYRHDYTSEYEIEVAVHNLRRIRSISIIGIAVIILYYAVTALFFQEMLISPSFLLFIPVLFTFLFYSIKAVKVDNINAKSVIVVTLLLYIVIMIFVILMSVFPHPDIPSVYYHLFIILAPVVFVIPAYLQLLMTLLSLPVFFVLVIFFKSPDCYSHELFEAATSAVFAIIIIFFMTQYRIQSDHQKNKYYQLSRIDTLTGTVNKNAGEAEIKAYLKEKAVDETFAILFVDLDDFKVVNDSFGHLEGDRILRMFGARLITLCRKDDVVCRFGGEEFIVLIKNVEDSETASNTARIIVEAINSMDFQIGQQITCSVGVYFGDGKGENATDLIYYADSALYIAKRNGKNCYETFVK